MLIQVKESIEKLIEKRLKYRFHDKERERSNHAVRIQEGGPRPSCPTRHDRVAWSGPPHDIIQCITCLDCGSWATEPEMKDMGYDFNDCPDWIFVQIFDARLKKVHFQGNPKTFHMGK
ncbi:MAG: hypothetical protein J3T61_00835 [Candidatus Brocadiales bacterium]|nr:hypothetical protein [Candidatus Bathyanammoxibius sp.]